MESSPKPHRRALVIINGKARRVDEAVDAAIDRLRASGVDCERAAPESVEALREAVRRGRGSFDMVVLAGGDGTLNAAIPALLNEGAPLGILPLGTANDLARTLAIPLQPEAAAEVIAGGQVARIDVGYVNGHPFFNVAHVGLGVHARHQLRGDLKRRWGPLSYPLSLILAVRGFRPFHVGIEADGETRWLRAVHVGVGNGRYYGGGVPVVDDADIDDGRFDLYCVRAGSALGMFRAAIAVLTGRQNTSPEVWRHRARQVRLRTRRPRRVVADGETVTRTPAEFTVRAAAVAVIVPRADDERKDTSHVA